jgi:hypothetical protein
MLDSEDRAEAMTHVPGSGIDFESISRLRILTGDELSGASAVPRSQRGAVRLAAPERLILIAGDFAVGDIAVSLSWSARGPRLGRPMQVVVSNEGMALALDDQSLPRSRRITPYLATLIEQGDRGSVWDLLTTWDVSRCPRCRAPGLRLAFGLPKSPAWPGARLGGCVVMTAPADMACSRCTAWWRVPTVERLA